MFYHRYNKLIRIEVGSECDSYIWTTPTAFAILHVNQKFLYPPTVYLSGTVDSILSEVDLMCKMLLEHTAGCEVHVYGTGSTLENCIEHGSDQSWIHVAILSLPTHELGNINEKREVVFSASKRARRNELIEEIRSLSKKIDQQSADIAALKQCIMNPLRAIHSPNFGPLVIGDDPNVIRAT